MTTAAEQPLQVLPWQDGFALSLHGRRLLRHSSQSPLLELGRGQGRLAPGLFWVGDQAEIRSEVGLAFTATALQHRLVLRFTSVPAGCDGLWLHLPAGPGGHLFGCSEGFATVDLRGRKVRLSRPTFLSAAGWYCHLDHQAAMELDSTQAGRHTLHLREIPREVVLGVAGDPLALVEDLSALVGRQPPLPHWAAGSGVWLGIQGGREGLEHKLRRARDAGAPVSAVWCRDWHLCPDLPDLAAHLRQRGIRFLGDIHPLLAPEEAFCRAAAARGFLVGRPDGEGAAMLDLTNPEAVRWIKGVIRGNLLGAGLSGWLCPADWAHINREAIAEAGLGHEVTFFCRPGSADAPLVAASGQAARWRLDGGLTPLIAEALSLGLCGLGHVHAGIGGSTTPAWMRRSQELFLRQVELAAFTPVMRTDAGHGPEGVWQFDSDLETLEHFARMSRIHWALHPYLQDGLVRYQERGTPLLRHLWLHCPSDPVAPGVKDQYLLGADLLVAPVCRLWSRLRRVYLPGNQRWVHLWSGKVHAGPGWVRVWAPPGRPPVFYRQESSWENLFAGVGKL